MSSVCPCCGQIVGSIPSPMDDLRRDLELEKAVTDAILYGEGWLVDGVYFESRRIKHIEHRDTRVSENDDDSEAHF